MNEFEPEHHVIARSLATIIDPEEHESGLAHEPGYKTKKEGMSAEGFFQVIPTYDTPAGTLYNFTTSATGIRRTSDLAVVVVRDGVREGSDVIEVYQPSNQLEYLIQNKPVSSMGYDTMNDRWVIVNSLGARLYRPQGFGLMQDEMWDWCQRQNIPFPFTASQIPLSAWCDETNDSVGQYDDAFATVRKVFMWTRTHVFQLSSPIAWNIDWDYTEWSPPQIVNGVPQPYLYRCRITGRPTTEKHTVFRVEHVGFDIPGDWITSTEVSWYFGTRRVFTGADVGMSIPLILALRNTSPDKDINTLMFFQNRYADNFGRPLAGNIPTSTRSVDTTVRWIYGTRTSIPVYRLVAGVTEIQSQDQNFNTGIIIPFSDDQGADVRNISVSEVLRANYHEYPIDSSPVRTHYVPRNEEDFKFFPFTQRGAGTNAYSAFAIIGACTGHSTAPTVAVTPLPRNFRMRFFGKVEHFNLRDGNDRDRHCPCFKAVCSNVAKLIGNTPGGAKMAKHTKKSKMAAVQAAVSAHGASSLPTPVHISSGRATSVDMTPPKTPSEQTGIVAEIENAAKGAVTVGQTLAGAVGSVVAAYNNAANGTPPKTGRGKRSRANPTPASASRARSGSKRRSPKVLWMR